MLASCLAHKEGTYSCQARTAPLYTLFKCAGLPPKQERCHHTQAQYICPSARKLPGCTYHTVLQKSPLTLADVHPACNGTCMPFSTNPLPQPHPPNRND